MNLSKMFETQKELRKVIFNRFPNLKEQNNLDWLVLALQVELGELANEHRGFKMWSEDREPRVKKSIRSFCKKCEGVGYTSESNGVSDLECLHCGGDGKFIEGYRNPLLEELADCLSFILEIGLEVGIDTSGQKITCNYTEETAIGTFNEMFRVVVAIGGIGRHLPRGVNEEEFHELINLFVGLGEIHLGFTTDQMEQAYYDKNKINHERQANNY